MGPTSALARRGRAIPGRPPVRVRRLGLIAETTGTQGVKRQGERLDAFAKYSDLENELTLERWVRWDQVYRPEEGEDGEEAAPADAQGQDGGGAGAGGGGSGAAPETGGPR